MQIENNSAYTSPLYTRATGKAANEDTGQASTPPPSKSQEASAADTAKATAVTGVTGSNLSKEMMDQLIATTQETDEKSNTGLSGPRKSNLDEIANNAEYAKKMSEAIGTGPDLIRIHESQMPKNGGDPAYAKSFYQKIDALQLKASEVSERRTKFYEAQVAQNVPPDQIYANLMEFNANLSQDYWNSMNIGYEKSSRTTSWYQAQHDYLQNLIDQGNSATASTKPINSSEETKIQEDKSVPDDNLATKDKDLLTKIFNNPDYARKGARNSGQYGYAPFISNEEFPKNGASVRVLEKFAKLNKYRTLNASVMQAKRFDFYKSEVKKGVSPAQLYANILQFNADLPQSYWSSIGYNSSAMKNERFQGKHDYLQSLIDQGNSATASTKSIDSTKVEG